MQELRLGLDVTAEARLVRQLTTEIETLDDRIAALYADADPAGIIASAPEVGPTLAPAILGRLGDAKRFRDLAAVRNYTGLVPEVDEPRFRDKRPGLTKAGDHVLRQTLFLAADPRPQGLPHPHRPLPAAPRRRQASTGPSTNQARKLRKTA